MKSFLLTKNKYKKKEKQPDYNLTFIDDKKEGKDKFVKVGVAWKKKNKAGEVFLSLMLNSEREYEGKKYPGYKVIQEGEPQGYPDSFTSEKEQQTEEDPFDF